MNISQIKPMEIRIFFKPSLWLRRKCWNTKSRIPGIKSRSDRYPDNEDTVFNETTDFAGEDFEKEFNISARMRALRLLDSRYTKLPMISKAPAICNP